MSPTTHLCEGVVLSELFRATYDLSKLFHAHFKPWLNLGSLGLVHVAIVNSVSEVNVTVAVQVPLRQIYVFYVR